MSRLQLTSGLLMMVAAAGTAAAQTSSAVPPPPPPGQVTAPTLEGPTTDLEAIRSDDPEPRNMVDSGADTAVTSHDAALAHESRRRTDRVYAPKGPPAPITERPSGARPQARAAWVPGYWDWDPARAEFFWMGGVWQVPPPDSIWVAGRWTRDQNGWYRASGFWSRRRGQVAVATEFVDERQPIWRTTGPPADHPVERATAAPGPDYFFVPGHYAPDGDQVRWKAGFWTRSQAGWDWVPARWVRRTAGWEFRAGHWVREPDALNGGNDLDSGLNRPARPPAIDDETDPIAEAEAGVRVPRRRGPVVVLPGVGSPYHVIRPPGMYPYGPGGVIVPDAVPPFVRNILNQVLP